MLLYCIFIDSLLNTDSKIIETNIIIRRDEQLAIECNAKLFQVKTINSYFPKTVKMFENIVKTYGKNYTKRFGELLPLYMMLSYEHPVYKNLIRIALDTNEPNTLDMVEKGMKRQGVKCDM